MQGHSLVGRSSECTPGGWGARPSPLLNGARALSLGPCGLFSTPKRRSLRCPHAEIASDATVPAGCRAEPQSPVGAVRGHGVGPKTPHVRRRDVGGRADGVPRSGAAPSRRRALCTVPAATPSADRRADTSRLRLAEFNVDFLGDGVHDRLGPHVGDPAGACHCFPSMAAHFSLHQFESSGSGTCLQAHSTLMRDVYDRTGCSRLRVYC